MSSPKVGGQLVKNIIVREDQVSHHDGRQQGLDARHFLQEREDREVPHDSDPQPVCSGVPQWRCSL